MPPTLAAERNEPIAASGDVIPIVRIGRGDDVELLYALAVAGGSGLTNLPADRSALAAKLAASERAIDGQDAHESGAAILLIVEMGGIVVGTSCVFPRVGAEWPFYSYRMTRHTAKSQAVRRVQSQALLNLVNDFDGETEVGGLFIDPAWRGHALGALAARARYLFIAAHRSWFRQRVIAELRGWQDEAGSPPVWEAVGRHFYDMEFSEADRTGALSGNQFIADLGPRYPLYVSMLPEAARQALGRPHDDGRLAYEMLLAEGFHAGDYFDIFDGGPTLVANIDDVRTVRESQKCEVTKIAECPGPMALVSTGRGRDFRVSRGKVSAAGTVDPSLAKALDLGTGDHISFVAV